MFSQKYNENYTTVLILLNTAFIDQLKSPYFKKSYLLTRHLKLDIVIKPLS